MESATPLAPRGAPAPAPRFSPVWRRNLRLFLRRVGQPLQPLRRRQARSRGIVDNKDFRLILERSLERSPSRLPPKEGRGPGRGGAGGAQPSARRAQDA